MDQRHLYEQTIAGKLEALPVPDLADAIWARIERQLDIDMPTDDGPGSDGGPQSPAPKIIIGSVAFVFLIAFISFFFFSKNNKQDQQPFNETVNPSTQTQEQFIKPDDPPTEPDKKRELAQPANKNIPPQTSPVDTAAAITAAPIIIDSSTINSPPLVNVPAPTIIKPPDSLPPGKKRKGVPNISDSDYRIIPKTKN